MSDKYEIMKNDYIIEEYKHIKLYRIKALKNFGAIKKGTKGGYVESVDNLSQEGNCWINFPSMVCDNAKITDNATILGSIKICDNAKITNDVTISIIKGYVYGNVTISDNVVINCTKAIIHDNVTIKGSSIIGGIATICNNVLITDNSKIAGDIGLFGDVIVSKNSDINGFNIVIDGDARICDGTIKTSGTKISRDAFISGERDYITVGPIGSRNHYTTFYKTKSNSIMVCCGCFNDTLDKFKERVIFVHGKNKYSEEYLMTIDLAKKILSRDYQYI